jgi:cytochrome c-type biogenesis protein CcmE
MEVGAKGARQGLVPACPIEAFSNSRKVMGNKRLKFGIGIGIILAIVAWEAISGFQQSKTYYVTVNELTAGHAARERVRVGGVVAPGSIARRGGQVTFHLTQDAKSVPVVYVGTDTLPDTFVGGAQAIVEGNYTAEGEFRAEKIQAKCASKYQAKPQGQAQATQNVSALEGTR